MANKTAYTVLEFEGNMGNVFTHMHTSIFVYVSNEETLKHVLYFTMMSKNTSLRQVAIEGLTLKKGLSIIKSLLSLPEIKQLGRSRKKKGGIFTDSHALDIRKKVLDSTALENQINYCSQHYDFEVKELRDYCNRILTN